MQLAASWPSAKSTCLLLPVPLRCGCSCCAHTQSARRFVARPTFEQSHWQLASRRVSARRLVASAKVRQRQSRRNWRFANSQLDANSTCCRPFRFVAFRFNSIRLFAARPFRCKLAAAAKVDTSRFGGGRSSLSVNSLCLRGAATGSRNWKIVPPPPPPPTAAGRRRRATEEPPSALPAGLGGGAQLIVLIERSRLWPASAAAAAAATGLCAKSTKEARQAIG